MLHFNSQEIEEILSRSKFQPWKQYNDKHTAFLNTKKWKCRHVINFDDVSNIKTNVLTFEKQKFDQMKNS